MSVVGLANPVRQVFGWFVTLLDQLFIHWNRVAPVLALALGVYLAWVIGTRIRSNEDPSFRYQSESGAGTTSIMVSGVHVTLVLVTTIALLTWPAVIQTPVLGLVLLGAVIVHFVVEKQEDSD